MADQRQITLYQGDATPKDVVLRDLPVATPSAGTTVYLYQGDATAKDVILRDPTTAPGPAGPVTGALAWTEADDVAALAGTLTVNAAAAWTEADDVSAAGATVTVTTALAWAEADDAVAAGATVTVQAALAWAEPDDAVAITADIAGVDCALAWTESDDVVSMSGLVGGVMPDRDTHDGGKDKRKRGGKRDKEYRELQERRRRELERAFEEVSAVPELAEQVAEITAEYAVRGVDLRIDFEALLADVARVEMILRERDTLIEEENAAAEVLVRAYLQN